MTIFVSEIAMQLEACKEDTSKNPKALCCPAFASRAEKNGGGASVHHQRILSFCWVEPSRRARRLMLFFLFNLSRYCIAILFCQ